MGGLYIENGVLYDRQSSWPCRSSVGVHFYAFHTLARETYDMWLPATWGGSLRTMYSLSVLVAHIDGTFSQRSCDEQD